MTPLPPVYDSQSRSPRGPYSTRSPSARSASWKSWLGDDTTGPPGYKADARSCRSSSDSIARRVRLRVRSRPVLRQLTPVAAAARARRRLRDEGHGTEHHGSPAEGAPSQRLSGPAKRRSSNPRVAPGASAGGWVALTATPVALVWPCVASAAASGWLSWTGRMVAPGGGTLAALGASRATASATRSGAAAGVRGLG